MCHRVGAAGAVNRYGVRGVGESPMKGSVMQDPRASADAMKAGSAVDRLANDFSKLQSPTAANGGALARNGVGIPYMLSQR